MEQRTPVGTETISNATPRVSKYFYDFGGRLVKEIYPSGREVKNEFEADGDLMRIYGKANQNAAERTYANSFSYTPDGRIEKLRLGNGLWESAKFNTRLQVTELALGHSVGDGSLWKLGYDYGEIDSSGNVDTSKNTGNIAKQTVSFNGLTAPMIQTFKYDSLYRLTEARETSASSQTWKQQFTYDRYGNRLTHNKFIGTTQVAFDNKTHPTINAATNRFNPNQGYNCDKNGNLIGDAEGRGFTFNGENKQTVVMQGSVKVGEYFYDGEGKRVKKKVYDSNGITVKEETVFVYSAGKLIAEYSTKEPPQNPTTNYTVTDRLGSPRVIVNSLGAVVSRRDFMPFGEEIYDVAGERSSNLKYGAAEDSVRQKFTGYQKDDETGLDFAEARMYENRHARFTAVDPLLASGKSSNPQTLNRYIYVMNNPLKYTDPSGLQAGQWYSPVTADGSIDPSRSYKYILSGDSTAGYSLVTERNKSGNLIGSFAGGESTGVRNRGPDFVLRFNPNGPREPQQMVDVNTGRKSYETLTDFERFGYEEIQSDYYMWNHPATGAAPNAIEPIDVALFLTPIKGVGVGRNAASGAAEGGENLLLRTMQVGDDGLPIVGQSATKLGARIPKDIAPNEAGMVLPGTGGVSVTPAGGQLPSMSGKNLKTFCISCRDLGPNLRYRPDPARPLDHGFIEPIKNMGVEEYQLFLQKTQRFWRDY